MYEEKIKSIVEQFALELKKVYGTALRNVILYGSYARGDFEKDSDIDILVRFAKDANITLFKYVSIANALQKLLHKKIDLVEEGQLKEFAKHSAEQDKILIYEREAER